MSEDEQGGVEPTGLAHEKLDPQLLALCRRVKGKRARLVIEHIIKHGFITNEELQGPYGYKQGPRAIRDVRERGVPLDGDWHIGPDGARRYEYRFGDPSKIQAGRIDGRRAFTADFKSLLLEKYGSREAFTSEVLPPRRLTIDHRVPYEVAGDVEHESDPSDYMLLDASSQRAKSFTCEACPNWKERKDPGVCRSCYWGSPEEHTHVATQPVRRVELQWQGSEYVIFEWLRDKAKAQNTSVSQILKALASAAHAQAAVKA